MKNGLDLIDAMGPDATREDYEMVRDAAQEILDTWEEDDDES